LKMPAGMKLLCHCYGESEYRKLFCRLLQQQISEFPPDLSWPHHLSVRWQRFGTLSCNSSKDMENRSL
jgi:hypothetical protein